MTDGSTRLKTQRAAAEKDGRDARCSSAYVIAPAVSGRSSSSRSWKLQPPGPALTTSLLLSAQAEWGIMKAW